MYKWVTHTWNPVRGFCPYNCAYCYTHRWGYQRPLHLDKGDLRADLGAGNFIFVCSGCDLFHPDIPEDWIEAVNAHVRKYQENQYLWHTKNPGRMLELAHKGCYTVAGNPAICTTIETNRWRPDMGLAPRPDARFRDMARISGMKKMITIEPVMDFDITDFCTDIARVRPLQVNIGADSGRNRLKEPSEEKLRLLVDWLASHTSVHLKKNLRRLMPEHKLYEEVPYNLPVTTARGGFRDWT
jgi:DNA repair photolyase